MKKYNYFVAYNYITKGGDTGVGNCGIKDHKKISSMDGVENLQALIVESTDRFDSVVIINFREFK